jgi:hypothetical protein
VGSTSYVFDDSAGAGITAYVVDTGIRTTHSVSVEHAFGKAFRSDWIRNLEAELLLLRTL